MSLSSTESESMLLDAIVGSPELPFKTFVGEKRNREIHRLERRESRFQHLLSWKLFEDNVGQVVDRRFIRPLAQEVVSLCCDHSDAIILMAAALKDASVADIWIKALQTLRRRPGPDQEKLQNLMVNVLKFSYGRLPDDLTRECLRHCIFLCRSSGNTSVSIHFLIESWMLEGLVSVDEGFRILETLISFNLLIRVDKSFVRMKKETRLVLLEYIILPEERLLFLIQSSKGLIKPPKVEEWQRFKGIYLMDNKLSELPNNPRCPKLHSLFLERNYKLRIIPSSFFDDMPKLQVLNLSRTSIKSLPESLFELVNLRRLFLNHCKLITSLSPKVGKLNQLELLDLEGTEIMYLPIEVGQLTKLTCLEVSFFEPMSKRRPEQASPIVPCGVISSLSKLEELHFDVSPDDKRWSAAAAEAIVSEVSKLQALSTLKFYFPKVELLSYFKWDSTRISSLFPSSSYTEIESLFPFPSFSCFRVTVGHIAERVISRIPCDAEFELERYDRYLKYVNGEGIPEDIKKVLKLATAFFIDRHSTVRTFSEFGYMNMLHQKCCVAGECSELRVIVDGDQIEMQSSSEAKFFLFSLEYLYIYHMKNLRSIWKGPVNSCSLCSLKSLSLHTCIELTTIFTPGLLSNFIKLEELTIDGCPKITSLISYDGSEYETSCVLPALKRMSLHLLPKLDSISNGMPISPRLELMSFRYCKNLKSLPINNDFNVELRKIKGELSWWRELKWEGTQQDSWDNIFEAVDKLK